MPTRRVRSAARLHAIGASEAEQGHGALARSASTPGLARRPATASAVTLNQSSGPSSQHINQSTTSIDHDWPGAAAERRVVAVRHASAWRDPDLHRVHTPQADRSLLHLLRTNRGAPPGRLSSEEYGRYVPAADGPAVRRKQTPGVRPHPTAQTEQVDKEARERRRPRAGLDERSDSTAQKWTLYDVGNRSSDTIGGGGRPPPVTSKWPRFQRLIMNRDKSAAEMNYMAQFAYCDSRVPPIGGHRRMTKFSDVLDAVRWQQRAIEKAAELSSWEARLDGTGENARAQHNEAHRIAERQRWADLKQRQTSHSSGNLMQREGFDSVYSEVHANKDTFSVLTPGSLVPSIDPRVPKIDPSALRSKDRPLLPTRSTMCIGTGPGRSIDF